MAKFLGVFRYPKRSKRTGQYPLGAFNSSRRSFYPSIDVPLNAHISRMSAFWSICQVVYDPDQIRGVFGQEVTAQTPGRATEPNPPEFSFRGQIPADRLIRPPFSNHC